MPRLLTLDNFYSFAESVAAPSAPEDYSSAAMERLMQYLSPYIVDVHNVHFKFHARNGIKLLNFQSREAADEYAKAWEEYQKMIALVEEKELPGGRFLILVQMMKFAQAAERIRAPLIADEIMRIVREGKSAVAALKFKETIVTVTRELVYKHGLKRDDISLIWGGLSTEVTVTRTGKRAKKVDAEKLKLLLTQFSVDELVDIGIEIPEEIAPSRIVKPLPPDTRDLRLSSQSRIARQSEIDRFQTDISRVCIFSFKAGGVGLSLHQELPHYRQRETVAAPTYSPIEIVQALGRAARLTSCSDTVQNIIAYAGTVELHMIKRASAGLRSLKKMVRNTEAWEDAIYRGQQAIDTEAKIDGVELNIEGKEISNEDEEENEE